MQREKKLTFLFFFFEGFGVETKLAIEGLSYNMRVRCVDICMRDFPFFASLKSKGSIVSGFYVEITDKESVYSFGWM